MIYGAAIAVQNQCLEAVMKWMSLKMKLNPKLTRGKMEVMFTRRPEAVRICHLPTVNGVHVALLGQESTAK